MAKKKAAGKQASRANASAKPTSAAKARKSGRKQAVAAARKKKASAKTAPKTAPKKKAAGATAKKPAAKKSAAKKPSLGRPKISADARLDEFFRKDYQARELFEFLGVRSVRELEAFSPDEIVDRLKEPIVQTVGRIRKALAMNNRCLTGDAEFAREFKQLIQSPPA